MVPAVDRQQQEAEKDLAIDETVTLRHPPVPSAGVSIVMGREARETANVAEPRRSNVRSTSPSTGAGGARTCTHRHHWTAV